MNLFFEVLLVLVLVFLFAGDPDPWDAFHSKAMSYLEPNDFQCDYK